MKNDGLFPLNQRFSFEKSAIQLNDGSWFQPLRDAKKCWTLESLASYRMSGTDYETLYQRTDNSFVQLQFSAPNQRKFRGMASIIECHGNVIGTLVDDVTAVQFLIEVQFEVPDELQSVLKMLANPNASPPVKPEPRPWSFWESQTCFSSVNRFAHEVRVIDLLPKIQDAAVSAIQEIRRWRSDEPNYRKTTFTVNLAFRLADRYRVDPSKWWGVTTVIPPADVDLLELPWPDGGDEVKSKLIPELRRHVLSPAKVLYITEPLGSKDRSPSEEEKQMAYIYLLDNLSVIEGHVLKLSGVIDDLLSGRTHEKLSEDGSKKLRPPGQDEIAAYLLRIMHDYTIPQIKSTLKLTIDDGNVSRMIKRAREMVRAGKSTTTMFQRAENLCRFSSNARPIDH